MARPKSRAGYSSRRKRPVKTANKQPALPQIPGNGALPDIHFEDDLWDAAVKLRGNIAPADYKHYVLPLLFLRYLSLKYERRREQLEQLTHDAASDYFTDDAANAGLYYPAIINTNFEQTLWIRRPVTDADFYLHLSFIQRNATVVRLSGYLRVVENVAPDDLVNFL